MIRIFGRRMTTAFELDITQAFLTKIAVAGIGASTDIAKVIPRNKFDILIVGGMVEPDIRYKLEDCTYRK
jgi:uncharacterized UPF0146 family protein